MQRIFAQVLRYFLLASILVGAGAACAVPLAGSTINNQATASYAGLLGLLTSNTVSVQVQQVSSFTLTSSQSRVVAPSGTVYFPHVLTNTGNGAESFDLSVADMFAGTFNIAATALYLDSNGDGQPDNYVPLSSTASLAPGATFSFVAMAQVPGVAQSGQSDQLTVSAKGTATLSPAALQNNTDTVTVSSQAVIVVSKSLDILSGPSPNTNGATHLTLTFTLVNNGNAPANNVTLTDVIGTANLSPAYDTSGMVYVPSSGRWNGLLALSDAAGGDPAGISYAATSLGAVTTVQATLATVPANSATQLSFQVDILPGLLAGSSKTNNIAAVTYFDGANTQTTQSNAALYAVQTGKAGTPDLVLSKSHAGNFTVGVPGAFTLIARNIGTAASVGNITVSDVLPVGLNFVQASSGGAGWTCGSAGQTVSCYTPNVLPAGASLPALTITVNPTAQIPATAAVVNVAQINGGNEPTVDTVNNLAADPVPIVVQSAASVSGRVWVDVNHDRKYNAGEALVPGWQVELLDAASNVLLTALTDANGAYTISPVLPGTGYKVRFREPGASTPIIATPVDGESGVAVSGGLVKDGFIQNITLVSGVNVVQQSLPLDPSGVVYDSVTRQPLAGAKVSITGPATFDPTLHLVGGLLNVSQITSASGLYQFILLPSFPAGTYNIAVTPPAGYVAPPSALIPPNPGVFTPPAGVGVFQMQTQYTPPTGANPTTYYMSFNLSAGSQEVVNNHIPLDPANLPGTGLFVQKTVSRNTAEIGDFLDYSVSVKNTTAAIPLAAVTLTDTMPRGFTYQSGTARLNGAYMLDPLDNGHAVWTFNVGNLAAGATATLSYRVLVGAGANLGDGINRVQASSGAMRSNVAAAAVKIAQGVFSDKAYIVGAVYMDCNRDHVQNADELGIPGVRLFLEDGTNVVTDSDGKYSLYGIEARTHILKVDGSTLPVGVELSPLANRNAGVGESRFVDLKKGELHRADFASGSCTDGVMKDVNLRRGSIKVSDETERMLNYKLSAQATTVVSADTRALPASGQVSGAPAAAVGFEPTLKNNLLNANNSNLPGAPVAAVPHINLEALLPEVTNNQFGFLDLKDRDVLPIAQTTVRLKGLLGSQFKLWVNGEEIAAERIGTKSTLESKKLEAWEFIGVNLKAGDNTLKAAQFDPFGNQRGEQSITLVAPDKLAKILIEAAHSTPADGKSFVTVVVRLVDERGVPVTARTPLTLEAETARWQAEDLDKTERGVQVFIQGGRAEFVLVPPTQPGDDLLRVSSGVMKAEYKISFLPELRPLLAAGVLEGTLNLRSLNMNKVQPTTVHDNFEQEIKHFARSNGKDDIAARAALFLKGKVRGDYLLTLAYDSDKDTQQRLFRDIQPDEFYPVYGDSSSKGFDAQSTGRFYVRIDKQKSYLLYGDYSTQANVPVRQLSQYNRSLTGIKEHYETPSTMINAFASRDTSRQVIEELPANGTSGPFLLRNNGALVNSEKVEILTRDRQQPALILKTEIQARFSDYEIEQYTGRILFKAPIASLDANLNPRSIRVTYELDQGGQRFWVSGVDGQYKFNERVEVGASVMHDNNPQASTTLTGVNATVKLADKTTLMGEMAQSTTSASGTGVARRIELRQDGDALRGRVYAGSADAGFDNSSAMLSKGRAEAGAMLNYKYSDRTNLAAEAIVSEDKVSGSKRNGVLLKMDTSLTDRVRVEAGVRDTTDSSGVAGAAANHTTSVRGKISAQIPALQGASVNGEYEQDLTDSAKRVAALGAEYQFAQRGRLYARHEFISSLTSAFALNATQRTNATVIGLDTDYTDSTHLFSEYRARGAIDGRQSEAAVGLRNKWDVAEGLRLNTSMENITSLAGAAGNDSRAYTAALDYTADPLWKGATRIELRNSTASNSWLNSVDAARKLSDSWTILGKHVYSQTSNKGASTGSRIQHRVQAGLAWRDIEEHDWDVLGKYEHRREEDSTGGLNLRRSLELVSLHANYQPKRNWQFSGHYAGKWLSDNSLGISSSSATHLFSGRATWDFTERWDIGLIASMLASNNFRSKRYGLGAEIGYLWQENLWLSAGVNFMGFSDADLLNADYTDKGMYVRMRYKFDEDVLSGVAKKLDDGAVPGKLQGVMK